MFLETFQQGGWVMWPLGLCSVALLAVLLVSFPAALWRRLRGKRTVSSGPSVLPTQASDDPPHTYAHRLRFFCDIPPQLGLLGTVLGLVQIFGGQLSPEAFGAGVSVACFTTIFGIALAIVARTAAYVLDALTP